MYAVLDTDGIRARQYRMAKNKAGSESEKSIPGFFNNARRACALTLMLAVSAIAYSNTFDVPMHFDDIPYIAKDPIVRGDDFKAGPEDPLAPKLRLIFKSRPVVFYTFRLDYVMHGLDVRGYHAVNLIIHLVNAALVYAIVLMILKSPKNRGDFSDNALDMAALFVAGLFALHPIETQAVTYITQRFASVAAMFSLLSMAAYLKYRVMRDEFPASKRAFYAASIVSMCLAMLSKESAFTFPIIMLLAEIMFFKGAIRPRLTRLLPLMLTMLIVPYKFLALSSGIDDPLGALDKSTSFNEAIGRLEYLTTETRVMFTYLRLLILPINQNLDHDYPVLKSLFDPAALISMAGLATILAASVWAATKSGPCRVMSFGVFWFFLSISVESSLVPLDIIFEHRLYLPSVGMFMAASALGAGLIHNARARAALAISAIAVLLAFAWATHNRNEVWRTRIGLWEDIVRKSPAKPRPHFNLANGYFEKRMFDRAMREYLAAIAIDPKYAEAHNNLGNTYRALGRIDDAIRHYTLALEINPNIAEAHFNLGDAFGRSGRFEPAIAHLKDAARLRPGYAEAHALLGAALGAVGKLEEAKGHLNSALGINPLMPDAYNNLGLVYLKEGDGHKAGEYFSAALSLDPNNPLYKANKERAVKALVDKQKKRSTPAH